MQAQTRKDFLSFVESFDWNLSKEQFEDKYASRILPDTTSLVAFLKGPDPLYFLDDMNIGEYKCLTFVSYSDESSSPEIVSIISDSIIKKHLPSVLYYKLDNILINRLGAPNYNKNNSKGWLNDDLMLFTINTTTENRLTYMIVASKVSTEEVTAIQDTFFGLKMGNKITSAEVENAIRSKGRFFDKKQESNSITYSIDDGYFAGEKWDDVRVICTNDGKFYDFTASNSYDIYDSDQEKDAKKLYRRFKEKLDDKYGQGEEQQDDEGNLFTTYFGSNNIRVMLSDEILQSNGGSYRRYVRIKYYNIELLRNVIAENDAEL